MVKLLNRIFLSFVVILLISTCKETTKFEIDETPPNLSIPTPISGKTVNGICVIVVNTDDNVEIGTVEFYINDILEKTQSESPFFYDWNTTKVEDGDYIIKVISYDTSDNFTESQPILLKVDNTDSYPTPISILSVIIEGDGLRITWNKKVDYDIQYYSIARSITSNRDNFDYLYLTMDTDNDTTYFDSDTNSYPFRSYRIKSVDVFDLETEGPIFIYN